MCRQIEHELYISHADILVLFIGSKWETALLFGTGSCRQIATKEVYIDLHFAVAEEETYETKMDK